MSFDTWRRCAVALALAVGSANATAKASLAGGGTDSALWGAVQTIATHLEATQGATLDSSQMEQLASVLSAGNFDTSNPDPIAEYAQTLLDLSLGKTPVPVAELVPQLTTRLTGFFLNRDGNAGLEMGALLYPYMEEAGLCERKAGSNGSEGVICQFTFGTEGANIAALTDAGEIPYVSPDSVLGQILSAVVPGGTVGTTATTKTGYGSGSTTYNLLGVPIAARYAYYYAWQYNCGSSCRASAAGYGAINGTYAAVGADTVFAAAGAALYCGWNCLLQVGWDYLNGRNLLTSVLNRGDKRYQEIHAPAKAVHALIPACGTVPASYAASPAHYLLENMDIELPYDTGVDIKFGTYFQKPNANGQGAALFPNLDPGPPTRTHYKTLNSNAVSTSPAGQTLGSLGAKLAVVGYEYEFTQLQSWAFDIIFAAADSATSTVPSTCYSRVPASMFGMGSGYASGDVMWFYQGFAKPNEDYDLPTISMGIGF